MLEGVSVNWGWMDWRHWVEAFAQAYMPILYYSFGEFSMILQTRERILY